MRTSEKKISDLITRSIQSGDKELEHELKKALRYVQNEHGRMEESLDKSRFAENFKDFIIIAIMLVSAIGIITHASSVWFIIVFILSIFGKAVNE